MISKFFNWFSKSGDDLEMQVQLPKNEEAKFVLIGDEIRIGILYCEKGDWYFKYTDEFKHRAGDYNHITGFPDLGKVYKSDTLWPFFQIRIPGLKQPAIQEILKNSQIDKSDEVALLKRFGKKSIANPYELLEMA